MDQDHGLTGARVIYASNSSLPKNVAVASGNPSVNVNLIVFVFYLLIPGIATISIVPYSLKSI